MKRHLLHSIGTVLLPIWCLAAGTHLDIMVPDIKDTDLSGPVKSVEMKIWRNVSDEYTTEKREYDRTGNLLKISEHDGDGNLVDSTTFFYDENGCFMRKLYKNEKKGYEKEWKVELNPETRQIARLEKNGRICIETYSAEGYLLSYRLMNKDRQPIVTKKYTRDKNNRTLKYTRIEERKPLYTYYYKWADNGFIDMEHVSYHQKKSERLHTYEYLVSDDHENWTQRIMVRYDITDGKREKTYERTVQRKIEYFDDEEPEHAEPEDVDTSTNAVEAITNASAEAEPGNGE